MYITLAYEDYFITLSEKKIKCMPMLQIQSTASGVIINLHENFGRICY